MGDPDSVLQPDFHDYKNLSGVAPEWSVGMELPNGPSTG